MNEINDNVKETIEKLNRADESAKHHDPAKKREIVKTILIIFLAAMLVLTFFSNTIMNKSLPEISTETGTYGKLTERVRGSGMVEANSTYAVTLDGNREVGEIFVKAGQTVAEGDVLFTVGTGESAELDEAEKLLETLTLDYQKSLLTLPADYSSEDKAIADARDDLAAAVAKREAAAAKRAESEAELAAYSADKAALAQKNAEKEKLTAALSALDSNAYTSITYEYTGSLAQLYSECAAAESAYSDAYSLYMQLAASGSDASQAKADADSLKAAAESSRQYYESQRSAVQSSLLALSGSLDSEINALSASVAAYEASAASKEPVLSDAELAADVTAKQRTLETLIIELAKEKKEADVNTKMGSLDTQAKKTDMENQQKKVDELRKKYETTEICSKHSGIVTAVDIKPGELTVPDMPLVTIDIADKGYIVKVPVEASKAEKVKTGAKADVVNNWSGSINAELTAIKNDTQENSENVILEFTLTGDVDSGTYADLSIPCGSGDYDCIIPKSAVHEDSNGTFVLKVVSKHSPLGNRYYAERVNVSVLASDEVSSAVQGDQDLHTNDYFIVASSKPINPGDQVRMK